MFREGLRPPDPFRARPPLEEALTQDGVSLHAFSLLAPVVVVCMPGPRTDPRLLATLSEVRPAIERAGRRLALVLRPSQVADLPEALRYVARIEDAEGTLRTYFEVGATKASLFRKSVELPGAFLLVAGEVRAALRPRAPEEPLPLAELA